MDASDKLRPPRERGLSRALVLALLVHLLLIALITAGVHWRSHEPEAVEAELWAPTAHLAAPPAPKPEPRPAPTLKPVLRVQPAPPPPPPPKVAPQPEPDNAQIALQRKKLAEKDLRAQQLAQRARAEQARERAEQEQRAQQAKLAAQKKLEQQQRAEQEKLAEQKKLEEQKRAEQKKLEARKLAEQKRRDAQIAREQKAARQAYIKDMMAQAGNGPAGSTGNAARSSGPSGGYSARLATLVRENTVYPQIAQVQGDPQVLLTVTLDTNNGHIISVRIKRSSGVPSWDEAAKRAVERVGRFPSDHGQWYSPMDVQAGPRDRN